ALDRAIRLGAEETLGLIRVNAGAAHRVDKPVTLFDETDQLLELGTAELALGGEHGETLALLALERSESTDQRESDLPFAQIGAELLSSFGGMAEEIDHVVGDLEGHADRVAEAAEALRARPGAIGRDAVG